MKEKKHNVRIDQDGTRHAPVPMWQKLPQITVALKRAYNLPLYRQLWRKTHTSRKSGKTGRLAKGCVILWPTATLYWQTAHRTWRKILWSSLTKSQHYIAVSPTTMTNSNSIVNQRAFLTKFAKGKGFRNIEYFVDDGYSGANFQRPDW